MDSAGPILAVEGLEFDYPDGTAALRGVDFSLPVGSRAGLVGPNGSGKSTLLMCLAGLLVGRGRIRVAGRDPCDMTRRRPHAVGLVFQNPDDQLFMPTVREDIAFGPRNLDLPEPQVNDRVATSAARMGVAGVLERPPHHLSMGQRRNVAIAGVLAMQPTVLMLDEPSSNLDPRGRRRLIELLESLDTTLLIASHDLRMVRRLCGLVLLIDEGRIVARGGPELLADAALMERHGLEAVHADA